MSAPPPPPPPAFNLATSPTAGGDQGRNLLLQSIRNGKSLKKTVTVDKSGPCISGKVKNPSTSSNSTSSSPSVASANSSVSNNGPMGLGGLFAGGMPKLKATGLRGTIVEKNTTSYSNPVASNSPQSAPSTMKRGPPPAPPPAAQKPQLSLPQTTLEPTTEIKSFGKPMLAPKPPLSGTLTLQKPCPPPKKPELLGGSVSRAQSMRLPRSAPVLAPTPASLHQSQDCLHENQQRPINRVLRPPIARPPSPPTARISSPSLPSAPGAPITRVAPPPPNRTSVTAPSMPPPPPPPPHRSNLPHQRLAPPPPPTPPTRNLSLSNGQSTNNTMDLEIRFGDLFQPASTFPLPEPFRGVPKLYNSKNAAKQQAPAPPSQSSPSPSTMVQLSAATGGKQWPHNSASSVC